MTQPFPIVIVGHIDHGKSTLIGRMLYETGGLNADVMSEIQRLSPDEMNTYPFAHQLDHFAEERSQGITMDTTERHFSTENRDYLIIDAPGHREFLQNMVTGASQAKAAVLIVDVQQGLQEQTRQHGHLLKLIGLEKVVVVLNKMDLVEYQQASFDRISEELRAFLTSIQMETEVIVPVSAQLGVNLRERHGEMAWYEGVTLIEALDAMTTVSGNYEGSLLAVQDIYNFDGHSTPVGRVESGEVAPGTYTCLPRGEAVEVVAIGKYKETLGRANAGDCVHFALAEGQTVVRGDVLARGKLPDVGERIVASVVWLGKTPGQLNQSVVFRCGTQSVVGRLAGLTNLVDAANLADVREQAEQILHGQVAEVEVALEAQVVTKTFQEVPELGRFVLESRGELVAGGIFRS